MTSFSKGKFVQFVALIAVALATTACSSPEEAAAREKAQADAEVAAKKKMENPDVKIIGTFDGCEVKFYERSRYTSDNFFIAKCVNAEKTTTVSSFEHTGGKFPRDVEKFDITQEQINAAIQKEKLAAIDAKKAALMAEQERLIKKQKEEVEKKNILIKKAKGKLSAEELEALGIK
jgi:hypothetical protein